MNTDSNSPQFSETKTGKPIISQLWQDIKKYKKLYYKVLSIIFIASAIITLSIPNYYRCTVKLAPELSGNKSAGALANLATSFGVNIGSSANGSDALAPYLYPDLMNSVAFRVSLFAIDVKKDDCDSSMTYYNYLLNEQKYPWWESGIRYMVDAIKSLFGSEKVSEKIDPFRLTKEQYEVSRLIEKKIVCDVDKKTMVITINVNDQDPLIAATLADSVQQRLQYFITDYRTRKARVDLEYNQKLLEEAEAKYDKARLEYVAYSDANLKTLFEEKHSKRLKLENKMQIEARAYSQVAAQVQMAEAKVQEETPAFVTFQPASVPVKKSGPKRSLICILSILLAFLGTTLYILDKEGDIVLLFTTKADGYKNRE